MSRRQGWLGVDFGAAAVKIAQLERRAGVPRLVCAAVVERDAPWDSTLGPDSPAVRSAGELQLATSLANGPHGGLSAACVLSMKLYELRSMHVAGVGGQEAAAVEHELASIYAGSHSPRIHDYWSTKYETTPGNADNINAVTVANNWTEAVCDDLDAAGLFGEAIDAPPLAYARAIQLNGENSSQPVLAIDWGFNCATVSVLRRDQPIFVRSLRDSGYRNIIDHVERALGLTGREACKVMADFGLPESPHGAGQELQQAIAEIVSEPLKSLCDELDRTLCYVRSSRRGNEPAQAWLFGGGATMRNADRFIERALGVRTQNYSLNGERVYRSDIGEIPIALLGAPIGLSALGWGTL